MEERTRLQRQMPVINLNWLMSIGLFFVKHWLLCTVIVIGLLGYKGYLFRNDQFIAEHIINKRIERFYPNTKKVDKIFTLIITREGFTPRLLAWNYIDDLSHGLGAKLIIKLNKLKGGINTPIPIGTKVKIPKNDDVIIYEANQLINKN